MSNKAPNLWCLADLLDSVSHASMSRDGKHYVPARPLGWDNVWSRLKLARLVFTGRADALIWPDGQ